MRLAYHMPPNQLGDSTHLAFRVFCAAVTGGTASTLPFVFEGAFGLGAAAASSAGLVLFARRGRRGLLGRDALAKRIHNADDIARP